MQFVPARLPRPHRIRPSNGKGYRDDQALLTHDHQKQPSVQALQHALLLAALPPADEPQLGTILMEYRILPDPGQLPAALGGRALVLHITPEWFQHLKPQAPQPLQPGAFGKRPEQA